MKDVKKEAEQTLAAIGIHAICSATIRSEHPERVSFSKQRQPSASSSGHEINLLTGAIALTRSEYAAGSWRGPCPDLAETLPGSGRQGASNAFGVENSSRRNPADPVARVLSVAPWKRRHFRVPNSGCW